MFMDIEVMSMFNLKWLWSQSDEWFLQMFLCVCVCVCVCPEGGSSDHTWWQINSRFPLSHKSHKNPINETLRCLF